MPFCFYVEEPDDDIADRIERLTKRLNDSREWLSGGITFVNEVDQSESPCWVASAIVIEHAGEEIGSIEGGAVDRSLTAGLIEPWKQRLAERP